VLMLISIFINQNPKFFRACVEEGCQSAFLCKAAENNLNDTVLSFYSNTGLDRNQNLIHIRVQESPIACGIWQII
jgi:hypothetical protein